MFIFCLLALSSILINFSTANVGNLICYYDSAGYVRQGDGHFALSDLEPALTFCNYLIYGYASVDRSSWEIKPRWEEVDVMLHHYEQVTSLKKKFPHLRVLLSVGGDKDLEQYETSDNKYLTLLESMTTRHSFVESARQLLRKYNFDGLDLAWQFPKTPPIVKRGTLGRIWNGLKGIFQDPSPIDANSEEHKQQFHYLVQEFATAFKTDGRMLTLTILPNVDVSLFIDVPLIINNVDFITVATFDFVTPERDPKQADFPAPIYVGFERDPKKNVNYHVQFWQNQTSLSKKINIGIPAFGRTWIMSKDSGLTGYPPVVKTKGVASGGNYTNTPGLLSWPEICLKFNANKEKEGDEALVHVSNDPTKRYGSYAYRSADDNGEHGLWIGYENPNTAAIKTEYVMAKGLGGVALFDLTLDDFKGVCAGEKYPILRSIKYRLY